MPGSNSVASSGPNEGSPSTTWAWRRVKISRAPQANKGSATKSHRWRRFGRRDPAQAIQVTLAYKGGAQGWVMVSGRGERNVYPGDTSLLDLVLDINQAW